LSSMALPAAKLSSAASPESDLRFEILVQQPWWRELEITAANT